MDEVLKDWKFTQPVESGYVKELSREEFISKMQEYDVIGFRVVLREGK